MKKRVLIILTIIVLSVTFLIGQQNVSAWGAIPGRYGTPVVGVYGDSIGLFNSFNQPNNSVWFGNVDNNRDRPVPPPVNNGGFDDGVAPVDPIAGHGIKHGGNNPPVKKTQPGNPIDFIRKKLGLNPTNPNNNNYLNNNNYGQSFLVAHAQFAVVPKQGQPPYKYYWSVTGLSGMASFDDPHAQKPTLIIKVPIKNGKIPVSFPKDLDIACKVTDANEKTYTSTFKTTIKLKNNPVPPPVPPRPIPPNPRYSVSGPTVHFIIAPSIFSDTWKNGTIHANDNLSSVAQGIANYLGGNVVSHSSKYYEITDSQGNHYSVFKGGDGNWYAAKQADTFHTLPYDPHITDGPSPTASSSITKQWDLSKLSDSRVYKKPTPKSNSNKQPNNPGDEQTPPDNQPPSNPPGGGNHIII